MEEKDYKALFQEAAANLWVAGRRDLVEAIDPDTAAIFRDREKLRPPTKVETRRRFWKRLPLYALGLFPTLMVFIYGIESLIVEGSERAFNFSMIIFLVGFYTLMCAPLLAWSDARAWRKNEMPNRSTP